jgi:hypothetical protein
MRECRVKSGIPDQQPLFILIDSEYTYEQLNYQMGLANM